MGTTPAERAGTCPETKRTNTMRMSDILRPDLTVAKVDTGSKKRLMQFAAEFVVEHLSGLESLAIYDALIARERLGSTAIGFGAAIPHCRLAGLQQAHVVLFQLQEAIPFDAPDNRPVQLVFVLLVPEEATEDHLQILKLLAESLSDQDYRIALLEAANSEQLYDLATTRAPVPSDAAN